MNVRVVGTIALAVALAGCVAGPEPHPTPTYQSLEDLPAPASLSRWWTRFDDIGLTAAVDAALVHNRRIEAARARVREASARRAAARSVFFPSAGVEGGYTWSEQSINSPAGAGPLIGAGIVDRDIEFWNGTLSARWDLDIFGGTRRLNQAARARVQQSVAARDAVALGVVAETASAWIELEGAMARRERATENVELQRRTVDILNKQAAVGLVRKLDSLRAISQLETTRSALPTLDAAVDAAAWRLAVLTGRALDDIRERADTLGADSDMGAVRSMALPPVNAAYLRQRPDVAAAERNLAAAIADVGVSEAAFWPQVWLAGSAGVESGSLSDLAEGNSRVLGFAPRVSIPLFQGGRLRAGRAAAVASADVAYQDLEQVLVDGMVEARTVARQVAGQRAALARLLVAADAARESERIATKRFELGLGRFLELLDAQRERVRLDDELATLQTRLRLSTVQLFAALGGDAPALLTQATAASR